MSAWDMITDKEKAAWLGRLSGIFSIIGFITFKLKSIPVLIVSYVLTGIALTAFLLGYLTWFIAARFYPDHLRKDEAWYGFTQFKDQFQLAALIGIIATIATIACFVYPALIIPAAWLYAVSNTLWCIAEYHKKNNPPFYEEDFSTKKQIDYFRYALLLTMISFIGALTASLVWCIPSVMPLTINISSLLCLDLSVAAFYYWRKVNFMTYDADLIEVQRYPIDKDHAPSNQTNPIISEVYPRFFLAKKNRSEVPAKTDLLTHHDEEHNVSMKIK